MKLTIGFSPCPNDTFIFDALVNKKIDIGDLEFEPVLEDVQTLNEWALAGKLDITKLSLPALFQSLEQYAILNSGSALGKGVGPLLIAKKSIEVQDVPDYKIAIPGKHTTAHFLLSFAFPDAENKISMLFSSIEDAVLNNEVDLGVIIHENRFTYQDKGLVKICDLGEIWEQKQDLPIPLGCIAIKRSISAEIQEKVDELIRKSVEYSYSHYPNLSTYITSHAQEMEEEVMRKHIDLYVNDFSIDLKEEGKAAIKKLFDVYQELNGHAVPCKQMFVSEIKR